MADAIDAKKFLESIRARVGDKEYNEKNLEFDDMATTLGMKDYHETELYKCKRWNMYLAKTTKTTMKETNVQMVMFNIGSTDFGAHKNYDAAIKAREEDFEEALTKGLIDKKGNPVNTKGYLKGKPIDINRITMQGFGAVKTNDSEVFKKAQITVNPLMVERLPLFSLITTNIGMKPEDDTQLLKCGTNRLTRLDEVTKLGKQDIEELLENHLPGTLITVKRAKAIADENFFEKEQGMQRDFNQFFIVKGLLAGDGVFFTAEEKKNDILNITDDVDFTSPDNDEPLSTLTVLLPKDNSKIIRRIKDGATDIFVVGVPTKSFKEGSDEPSYMLNALGLWVDEKFIADDEALPIGEESAFKD